MLKNKVKGKITSITNLAPIADLKAAIMRLKTKYLVLYLATNTALTTVGNDIPNVSNLVKETDFNKLESYWHKFIGRRSKTSKSYWIILELTFL